MKERRKGLPDTARDFIISTGKGLFRKPFSELPEPHQAAVAVRPDAPRVQNSNGLIENWQSLEWGKEGERFEIIRVAIVKEDPEKGEIMVEDTIEVFGPLAVVVIPTRIKPRKLIWGEREFLLINEKRPQFPRVLATFPQGHLKEQESVEAGTSRELEEETGYKVNDATSSIQPLGSKLQDAKFTQVPEFYVLVEIPYKSKNCDQKGDDEEHISVGKWKTLRELEGMKLQFQDKRTIVAIDYILEHFKIQGIVAILSNALSLKPKRSSNKI